PAPPTEPLPKLNVTDFSTYLDCPFRFYLKKILKLQPLDLHRSELNHRDFGNLTHLVLEDFFLTPAVHSPEPELISQAFHDLLSTRLHQIYGQSRSIPLIIQEDSLRRRLEWWSHLEAEQRRHGWTLLHVEQPISTDEQPFLLNSLEIRGTIDRIEQHPDDGIRVLDFKTKAKPTPVAKAHLRNFKRHEDPDKTPDHFQVQTGKRPQRWSNLQVPLYLISLAQKFPDQTLTAGYVALGNTKDNVHLDLWSNLDPTLLASARTCAECIITSIHQNQFWPPNEAPQYDDFAPLFLSHPHAAFNPINLNKKTS
ncbi:MAG: PD-(D/E)XK nuclease family protein, partial [Verrucomicrobiota bacterium]